VIARVLRVDVSPDRVDAVLDAYRTDVRPIHAKATGLRQHYVLVDRDHGRITIIGVWDSTEAVAEIAAELEPARARLWAAFGQDPPLEIYQVADELR
jgi:quinol monooxygenase YgiN